MVIATVPRAYARGSSSTMRETKEQLKERTAQIVRALKKTYPQADCALNHASPFELLIATILSAQCTDERVNIVTADLFRKYRKPEEYFAVPQEELERDINSITFFRNKSKSIQETARLIVERHNGQVPQTLDELVKLAGVGRKTANVVLGTAFGIPTGVVVDTHVSRLSQRLGLTKNETPEKIESDLIELLPQKEWIEFSHRLIWHGRRVCNARKPACDQCSLESLCPSSSLKTTRKK
jgi:endonuclease-3